MKEYYLSPEFFKWHSKRLLSIFLIFAAFVILLIGLIVQFAKAPLSVVPLLLILSFVSLAVGLINGNKIWKSYCLLLDDTSISKKQKNYPNITIPFDKISKIIEQPGKGLIILSNSTRTEIHIPALISNYNEIREILQKSRVGIENQYNKSNFAGIIFILFFLVTFFTTLLSNNFWIMSTTGIPTILILLAGIITVQNNPNAPNFSKRWIWLTVIPIVSIVIRILLGFVNEIIT